MGKILDQYFQQVSGGASSISQTPSSNKNNSKTSILDEYFKSVTSSPNPASKPAVVEPKVESIKQPSAFNQLFSKTKEAVKDVVKEKINPFAKKTATEELSTKDLAKILAAKSAANPGADKIRAAEPKVFERGGYDRSLDKIVPPQINLKDDAKLGQKFGAAFLNTLSSTATDFLNRGAKALSSLDSQNTPAERVGAMGELATGGVNVAFSPISGLFEGGKATKTEDKRVSMAGLFEKAGLKAPMRAYGNMSRAIDGTKLDDAAKEKLKSLASLVTLTAEPGDIINLAETPFYLVGLAGTKLFSKALDVAPVDEATKEDLRPFVGELGGIVGMLGLGGLGMKGLQKAKAAKARNYAKTEITNQAHQIINNYSDIKLNSKATPEQIKAAYRSAAAKTHPDKGGSAIEFNAVNLANQYLSGKISLEKATVEFAKLNQNARVVQPVAGSLTGEVPVVKSNPFAKDIVRTAEAPLSRPGATPVAPVSSAFPGGAKISPVEPKTASPEAITTKPSVSTPSSVSAKDLPNKMAELNDIFSMFDNKTPISPKDAQNLASSMSSKSYTQAPSYNKPVQSAESVKTTVNLDDLIVKRPDSNDIYLEKSGDSYLFQKTSANKLIKAIKSADNTISDQIATMRASNVLQKVNEAFKAGQNAVQITEIGRTKLEAPIRLVKSEMKGKLPEDIIANAKPVKTEKINPEEFKYSGWNSEMESQYEAFKKVMFRFPNPRVRDKMTNGDAETFKKVVRAYGISPERVDNMLYSQEKTNHEVFDEFLDRFYNRNKPVEDFDQKMIDYYTKLEATEALKKDVFKEIAEDLSIEDIWGSRPENISENKIDSLIGKTEKELQNYEQQEKSREIEAKASDSQKNEVSDSKVQKEIKVGQKVEYKGDNYSVISIGENSVKIRNSKNLKTEDVSPGDIVISETKTKDLINEAMTKEPTIEGDLSAELEERANEDWENNPKYGEKIGELFQKGEELSKDLSLEKNKEVKSKIQKQIEDLHKEMNDIHESFIKKWEDISKKEKAADKTKGIFQKKVSQELSYPNKNPESGVKIYGHLKDGIAKLDSIEITPAKQKQGLGSKYVAEFEKWAKDNGAKMIKIDAYKKSEAFWEKKGYKMPKEFPVENGVVQDYKPGVKSLNNVFQKKAVGSVIPQEKISPFAKKQPSISESKLNPFKAKDKESRFDLLNMTPDQARVELYKMFPKNDVKLVERELGSVEINGDIFGKDIRGNYVVGDGVINVVMNDGRVNNRVVYHEAFHHYLNTYHPFIDKGNLLNQVYRENKAYIDAKKAEYGNDINVNTEEFLADAFADYRAGKTTFTGKIKALFDKIINHIRGLFGKFKSDKIYNELFDKIIAGEAKVMKKKQIFSDSRLVLNKKTGLKPSDLSSEQHKALDRVVEKISEIETKAPVPKSIIASLPYWKDKAKFYLFRETMERNLEDVAGDYSPAVKDFLVEPTRLNETQRAIFITALREKIETDIVKRLGIKKGSPLSALVQRFGEGEINQKQLMEKTDKWPQVIEASEYLRNVYDNMLDLWNRKRDEYGYEPVPKRKDYFRHGEFINKINGLGIIMAEKDLPTSISGLTDIFKPGTPFSTAAMKRIGVSTDYDAVAGIDNYIDAVSRSIFHTDSVQRGRALETVIRDGFTIIDKENAAIRERNKERIDQNSNEKLESEIPNIELDKFVTNLLDWTNMVSGKKGKVDRAGEAIIDRPFYDIVNSVKNRTSANMIAGNISSAITNLVPVTQLLATTKKTSVIRGFYDVLRNIADPRIVDGQISGFLARRFPKEKIDISQVPREINPYIPFKGRITIKTHAGRKLDKTWDKTQTAAGFLFKAVDIFIARWTVASKYRENLSNGMGRELALREADNYAGRVITDRSIGNLPNMINSKTFGIVSQFQTEINNQFSFYFHDMPFMAKGKKLKLLSWAIQYMIYADITNELLEKLYGRRPLPDPIYWAATLAGLTVEGKNKKLGKKVGVVAEDIIGNLPFVGGITGGRYPVFAGIPDIFGSLDGTANTKKELKDLMFYLVFPIAGGQFKKTIEGFNALKEGGSYSKAGLLQFPIDQTKENLFKTLLFGKYSTGDSKLYFGEERSPLGKDQTKNYQRLLDKSPNKARPYYEKIIEQREKDKEKKKRIEERKERLTK